MNSNFLVTMAPSLVYISDAYTGWNGASYLAGEVDRPQERMPRAILMGTALVLVLYLALNIAYMCWPCRQPTSGRSSARRRTST